MAIVSLQRLSSQTSRNPSLSLYSISINSRSSASSSSSSSKKVSDRIVKLFVIDLGSKKREAVGLSSQSLLKALANNGLIDPVSHRLKDIDACSAECEVNIAEEWLERLPPSSYDEQYVLKRNSRARVSLEVGVPGGPLAGAPGDGCRGARAKAVGYSVNDARKLTTVNFAQRT